MSRGGAGGGQISEILKSGIGHQPSGISNPPKKEPRRVLLDRLGALSGSNGQATRPTDKPSPMGTSGSTSDHFAAGTALVSRTVMRIT